MTRDEEVALVAGMAAHLMETHNPVDAAETALQYLKAAQFAVDSRRGCERDWERLEAAVSWFLQQARDPGVVLKHPETGDALAELRAAHAACQAKCGLDCEQLETAPGLAYRVENLRDAIADNRPERTP